MHGVHPDTGRVLLQPLAGQGDHAQAPDRKAEEAMTTPDRARAVARQCTAEGRSTPAAVVEVLLAELARADRVEAAARHLLDATRSVATGAERERSHLADAIGVPR